MKKILEVKNLKKSFLTEAGITDAIKDLTFDVYCEEFLCLVGSSGCGKSTLLNILSFLDKQSSGEFKYNIENPTIGYMLQEDALLPWLTILDNALLGLKIKNMLNKDTREYVINLLETYGLKDFMNKYPYQLSGGMKQRVLRMLYTHK